jgi:hypothetical protein
MERANRGTRGILRGTPSVAFVHEDEVKEAGRELAEELLKFLWAGEPNPRASPDDAAQPAGSRITSPFSVQDLFPQNVPEVSLAHVVIRQQPAIPQETENAMQQSPHQEE